MKTLDQIIMDYFIEVGEKTNWSLHKMSKIMGVTERTISNWKIKYGVGRVKRDARTLELDNWYNKNKW